MSVLASKDNPGSYPVASQAKRLLQLFRERLDEELRPEGVTAAQLHVLAAIDRDPGISGARLARACMVKPQTTQVLIRTLEAGGWVKRARHPENERILLARLTPAGKRTLVRSRSTVERIYSKMLESFSAEDTRQLEALLSRCAANLET